MIKKLLIMIWLVLLLPITGYSNGPLPDINVPLYLAVVSPANPTTPAVKGVLIYDDCSGDVMLSWHMEGTTIGTAPDWGCSDGDTTGTACGGGGSIDSNLFKDGASSLDCPGNDSCMKFDNVNEDIWDADEGKDIFWIYAETVVDDMHIFDVVGDANNYLYIFVNSSAGNDVEAIYTGQSVSQTLVCDSNFSTNQQVRVTYQRKVSETAADHKLSVDINDDGVDDCTSGAEDDLTTFSAAAKASSTVKFGNDPNYAADFHIDKGSIYATSGL